MRGLKRKSEFGEESVSVDERLISKAKLAGFVVSSVSAVGFMDPRFWYQSVVTSV